MSIYQALKKLTKPQCVEFAITKAESVIDLINNDELKALAKDCIDCAKAWLTDPTEENKKKCRAAAAAAADAAYAAAYAADAAYAAAYAADAAYATAYAAYAAYADAAAAAAYAYAAARAKSNQESLELIEKIKSQEQER